MSRRSRRRNNASRNPWLGKAAVGGLVLAVLALAGAYASMRSFLHSDAFRKLLSTQAGKVAGVDGEFSAFRWQGLAVSTESFDATGSGLVSAIRAAGLSSEVGLGGVRRGVWEIQSSSLRRLDVTLDLVKRGSERADRPQASDTSSAKREKAAGWFPRKAELQNIDVAELTLQALSEQGSVGASGMKIHAERAGPHGAYRADVTGGTIHLPIKFLPELRLDRLHLRYQNDQVFLTESSFGAWKKARISATGEWDTRTRRFSAEGEATDIKCDEVLSEDWAKRLTGDVVTTFLINNQSGQLQADGELTLRQAVVTALPVLDALAAYADTRRFRVLTLDDARTKWHWKKGEILLTDLVLSSDGLVRLEGSLSIRGQQLEGVFRLGLAPGTLATIPGAETDVFSPGERGLLWTPLRITGDLSDPKEDLTDRLIAAAGLRMFDQIPESGEKVIKFTQSIIGESSSKTLEKGTKIIEEGSKAVRDVSGILDGILGGKPEKSDETQ